MGTLSPSGCHPTTSQGRRGASASAQSKGPSRSQQPHGWQGGSRVRSVSSVAGPLDTRAPEVVPTVPAPAAATAPM